MHWHGIELESYPDGVPGWSGSGTDILPSIAPHDSLTVRWTPPRAGSFMYHSHFNEARQMGERLVRADHRPRAGAELRSRDRPDALLRHGGLHRESPCRTARRSCMNGSATPPRDASQGRNDLSLPLLQPRRRQPDVRLAQLAAATPVEWRAVAKDGYPLPASQADEAGDADVRSRRDLRLRVQPGEER